MSAVRLFVTVAITLAAATSARAGILLEPYVGYTYGQIKTKTVAGTENASDNNNLVIGGRAAYVFTVAMVGLDYAMNVAGRAHNTTSGTDYDWSQSTLWLIGGAQLPLIRAYAGYGLMNTGTANSSTTTKLMDGDAFKLGAGYTGFPMIAINLEYWMASYKKMSINGTESDIPNALFDKATNDLVVVSVSMPFEL